MKICILTAGKGTRMWPYNEKINKALLPVKNKAIISHLIEQFRPNDEFIIGLGYLGDQVKDYLLTAHPKTKFTFVRIKNYDGKFSGPGHSLLKCKKFLNEPFVFLPCDCYFPKKISFSKKYNLIGISTVKTSERNQFCNALIKKNLVKDIRDKEKVNKNYFAFTGFLYVKDHSIFWNGLKSPILVKNEHQISDGLKKLVADSKLSAKKIQWYDIGDTKKFHEIQKFFPSSSISKIDEFIYFTNNSVIKFFSNPNIIDKRIKKTKIKPKIFPNVKKSGKNFYTYPYWMGETFYSEGNPLAFTELLTWLETNVWSRSKIKDGEFKNLCKNFYQEKTISRISKFSKENPHYKFPNKINGIKVPNLQKLLKLIPWSELFDGIPSFIHGDLQFQNVLLNKKLNKFLLIDWRQDFAGNIRVGDLYYDLAKLYGGILMNYDLIIKDDFLYRNKSNNVSVSFKKWKNSSKYKKIFDEYILQNGFDLQKIHLLVGIIYLNMAALHHAPFNYALIAFGMFIISEVLNEKNIL